MLKDEINQLEQALIGVQQVFRIAGPDAVKSLDAVGNILWVSVPV